jgi:hypothetical protein
MQIDARFPQDASPRSKPSENGPLHLAFAHAAGWHSGSKKGAERPTKLPMSKSCNAVARPLVVAVFPAERRPQAAGWREAP